MTQRDIELIKARAKKFEDIIKAQEKLPKSQRDHAAISEAKKRLAKFNEWLKGEKKVVAKKIVTKKEFVEEFKKTFDITEGVKSQITIDDVASLRAVWPTIRAKAQRGELEIQAPKSVKHALKEMIKQELSRQKIDGFR